MEDFSKKSSSIQSSIMYSNKYFIINFKSLIQTLFFKYYFNNYQNFHMTSSFDKLINLSYSQLLQAKPMKSLTNHPIISLISFIH